jgi:hypothetical protein
MSENAIQNIVIENSRFIVGGNSGSIVGSLRNGTVQNCFVNARVVGVGGSIGGIVGTAIGGSVIQRCWFGDTVTSYGNTAAGIVASISDSTLVTDCFTTGHIQANPTQASPDAGTWAAGITVSLNNNSIVQNSYSTASIRARNNAGGIVAQLNQGSRRPVTTAIVQNCVAINRRIENTIAGANSGRIAVSYAGTGLDEDTVGITNIIRNNYALSNMVLLLGTTQKTFVSGLDTFDGLSKIRLDLELEETYTMAPFAWNFTDIWMMDEDGEFDYFPILRRKDPGTTTSIQELVEAIFENTQVTVFPNPTTGPVTVETTNGARIQQIYVYNLNGKLVYVTAKPEFTIERLSNGLYIIVVVTDKGNYASRIIKW